uniref:Reverse transcriptase domain-containing protein n=1 Tax=Micrurus surinamensis TaxID=129470 RepID=A0A2D4Q0C2_MICSU
MDFCRQDRLVRMVVNILEYYEAHREKQAALIFLDAQKAFDDLNWQLMIQQIKDMNFGDKFEKMIEAIYTTQKASVILNRDTTGTFKIMKGIRQGCPYYPDIRSIINLN